MQQNLPKRRVHMLMKTGSFISKIKRRRPLQTPLSDDFSKCFSETVKKTAFNDAKVTDLAVSDTLLPQETPAAMYVTQNLFRPRCHRGRR